MEQREKLSGILSGILSDWTNPQSFLVAFGAEENGDSSISGLTQLLEYYGVTQDAEAIRQNVEFMTEREVTRLQLQWTTSATVSILKRLREIPSREQVRNVPVF